VVFSKTMAMDPSNSDDAGEDFIVGGGAASRGDCGGGTTSIEYALVEASMRTETINAFILVLNLPPVVPFDRAEAVPGAKRTEH